MIHIEGRQSLGDFGNERWNQIRGGKMQVDRGRDDSRVVRIRLPTLPGLETGKCLADQISSFLRRGDREQDKPRSHDYPVIVVRLAQLDRAQPSLDRFVPSSRRKVRLSP